MGLTALSRIRYSDFLTLSNFAVGAYKFALDEILPQQPRRIMMCTQFLRALAIVYHFLLLALKQVGKVV